MALDRFPTEEGHNNIFHAIFGENVNGKYFCNNVDDKRSEVANHIRNIRPGDPALSHISDGIRELISINSRKITLSPLFTQHKTLPGNFDDATLFALKDEYANLIQAISLLPCELPIIAYACQKTIACFKEPLINQPETHNPGLEIGNIFFNGIYYQAMRESTKFDIGTLRETRHVPPTHTLIPIENSKHRAAALKKALHGSIYQLKLLMLFLHRGLINNYQFSLATEMDEADKFDDLVFLHIKPGDNSATYRFIQAKHTTETKLTIEDPTTNKGKISANDLLNIKNGDFSLQKYFISYLKIKSHSRFQNGTLGEFCIYTNKGFLPTLLQTTFEEIKESDNILQTHGHNSGNKYKFRQNFPEWNNLYGILKQCFGKADLANALVNHISNGIKIDRRKNPFFAYSNWLRDENILTDGSNIFTNAFLSADETLSEEALEFRELCTQKGQAVNLPVNDEDIRNFLRSLVFAVNQPNEEELGEIITRDLAKEFNVKESHFIYAEFQKTTLDWLKNKEAHCLGENGVENFFTGIKYRMSRLALIGSTIAYQRKLEAGKISFNPSKDIRTFLEEKNTNQIIVCQTQQNLHLKSIEVSQTIRAIPAYQRNDSYIFVELETALLLGPTFTNACKNIPLLVLPCHKLEEAQASTFIQSLLATLAPTQKVIFITTDQIIPAWIRGLTVLAENSFTNLTEISRNKLLETKICFQEKSAETPLQTLVNSPENIIDAEVLLELITNPNLSIGESLEPRDPNYILRTFKYGNIIKEEGLKENKSDFFLIANITKQNLKNIVAEAHIRLISEPDTEESSPKRYIIVDTESALRQFQQLYTANPTHTIHFLQYESNKFIWQQSQGNLSDLSRYVQKAGEYHDLLKHTIISAMPGMGKSTFLPDLAYRCKQKYPHAWVISINLLEVENKLKLAEFKDQESVIHFFIAGASHLARKIFIERLNHVGNVVIYLDGFDEIQAEQQQKVIQLLTILKTTKVAQIVVTTRPHMQEMLENALGVLSHELNPFTETNQVDFIKKYWQKELKLPLINTAQETYIKQLIINFNQSINDTQLEFISIPLQAKLLAVAFQSEFEAFCRGEDSKPIFSKFSMHNLYQRFVKAKYKILIAKNSLEEQSYLKPLIIQPLETRHQQLAFNRLFPAEAVNYSLDAEKTQQIKIAGMIQFIRGEPQFIHRTFAEYFAAQFLVEGLQSSDTTLQKYCKTILLKHIFKKRYNVIRTFIDEKIAESTETSLQRTWRIIRESQLLLDISEIYRIDLHLFPSNSNLVSDIDPQQTLRELNNRWTTVYGQTGTAFNFVETFFKTVVNIENIESLVESIEFLHLLLLKNPLDVKVKDKIRNYIGNIYWHYIRTCKQQGISIDKNLLQEIHHIKTQKELNLYIEQNQKITPDFIQELTEGKILFCLIKELTSAEQRLLFTELINCYPKFTQNNDSKMVCYKALLIKLGEKFFDELQQFFLRQQDFDLLSISLSTCPKNKLTATQIETIFFHKDLLWLEKTGIQIIDKFKILTPFMAKIFNGILPPVNGFYRGKYKGYTKGYYTGYAVNIWRWLQTLLNKVDETMVKNGIDRVALLDMTVNFMQFSEINNSPFSLTLTAIQNILKLVEIALNQPDLTPQTLSICVTQLYLIRKTGFQLIDTGSTLLILEPTAEFEYELPLPLKQLQFIRKLLIFKADTTNSEETFAKECELAMESMTALNSMMLG